MQIKHRKRIQSELENLEKKNVRNNNSTSPMIIATKRKTHQSLVYTHTYKNVLFFFCFVNTIVQSTNILLWLDEQTEKWHVSIIITCVQKFQHFQTDVIFWCKFSCIFISFDSTQLLEKSSMYPMYLRFSFCFCFFWCAWFHGETYTYNILKYWIRRICIQTS